jgi:hypothetical protein
MNCYPILNHLKTKKSYIRKRVFMEKSEAGGRERNAKKNQYEKIIK